MFTRTQWVTSLLNYIGNSNPTQAVIDWTINWTAAEDNSINVASYNLLNTTEQESGSRGTGTQGNIQIYMTYNDGIKGNGDTLLNGRYPTLSGALKSNNIQVLSSGNAGIIREMSIWGTGYKSWYATQPAAYLLAQQYTQAGPSGSPIGSPIINPLAYVPPIGGIIPISPTISAFSTVTSNVHDILNTVPGFIGIVEALDIAEQFQPLELKSQITDTNPTDYTILGIDTGIPNPSTLIKKAQQTIELPADNIQALLVFMTVNSRAFTIRFIMIFIGVIILIALVMNAQKQVSDKISPEAILSMLG